MAEKISESTSKASGRHPDVHLHVDDATLPFFTTLLQYGIVLTTTPGTSLISFLSNCPGLSKEYLAETVQTIFLNGNAVDRLDKPLSGTHPIIALSAAMPGLAGAIFRKNSPHSPLRTATATGASDMPPVNEPLSVTVKLFNQIAREKGRQLLGSGVVIAAPSVAKFLQNRPELLMSIKAATIDDQPVAAEQLIRFLASALHVHLVISEHHDD